MNAHFFSVGRWNRLRYALWAPAHDAGRYRRIECACSMDTLRVTVIVQSISVPLGAMW